MTALVGSVACQVCRRTYRSARTTSPFVCGIDGAERSAAAPSGWAAVSLVVLTLAERSGPNSWLCLEPLLGDELARRRALLRHNGEPPGR